jgi:hypothetical protein
MTFVASAFFMRGRILGKGRRIFTYEGEIRPHSGEVRDISAAGSVSLFMEENPTATIAFVRAFLDKKQ